MNAPRVHYKLHYRSIRPLVLNSQAHHISSKRPLFLQLNFTSTKPYHCFTHSSMHRLEHSRIAQYCFETLGRLQVLYLARQAYYTNCYISNTGPSFHSWISQCQATSLTTASRNSMWRLQHSIVSR